MKPRTLCGIVLSATLAAGISGNTGCMTVAQQVEYDPNQQINVSELASSKNLTRETLFQSALQEIIQSNIINPDFIPEIASLRYYIIEKSKEFSGLYNPQNRRITTVVPQIGDEEKAFDQKYTIRHILNHEIAHHYFTIRLTTKEQDDFRDCIKRMYARFEKAREEKKNFTQPSDIEAVFAKYSLTSKEYNTFVALDRKKEYYKKYYGDHFEKQFYETEAFAYIVEPELSTKVTESSILKLSQSELAAKKDLPEEDKLLDIRTMKIAMDSMKHISYIPEKLIPFYRGLFNQEVVTDIKNN